MTQLPVPGDRGAEESVGVHAHLPGGHEDHGEPDQAVPVREELAAARRETGVLLEIAAPGERDRRGAERQQLARFRADDRARYET